MKKLALSLLMVLVALAASEAALYACGSKFLVNSRSSVALMRARANTEPTTLLVYWQQDEQTLDEDKWSDNATKYLEDVGHTVTVTHDDEAFLAAARDGGFEVLMVKVDDARRLSARVGEVAPRSVVLPMLFTATRSERQAAEAEFARYLQLPGTLDKFLHEISEAGKAAGN